MIIEVEKLHGTIISFFDGIDEQRAHLSQHTKKTTETLTSPYIDKKQDVVNDILPTSDIDKKQNNDHENIDDSEKTNIQEF